MPGSSHTWRTMLSEGFGAAAAGVAIPARAATRMERQSFSEGLIIDVHFRP